MHSLTTLQRARQQGFTLIEIMVVVVILGILAAVVVPRVMDRPDQARLSKAQNDIRAIEAALNLYRLDNFDYPATEQGLRALVTRPTGQDAPRNWRAGGYLERLQKDPWGNDYQYLRPGREDREFDLFSMGADGRPGGTGNNADIGNWELQD
ncbi:MAG: type II secretion system major pseudopilin GspG [Halopseudomonas yangmingensis]|uniref:Type II secretion system core protein G n=1 Tax=Halopseudomonas yangmingensis TaxID=1720063 RepID=A0A1I4U740_9GAMM|nr:type II secretion system major pseudopilin GspG [Halopseudomonas yangmingensis]SFM84631.1 general secretion pathway protein G [Halopseudomonas yangmingensis]